MTPALMAAGRAGGTTIMIMSSVLNIMIPKEAWNKTSYKRYYIFSWFSSVVPDIFWDSLCVSIYIYIYIHTHTNTIKESTETNGSWESCDIINHVHRKSGRN